jgi:hypothetical protein
MLKRNQITVAIALFAGLTGATLSSAVTAAAKLDNAAIIAKQEATSLAERGRGKDDPADDDRGTHGAGHAKSEQSFDLVRRGTDDAAGGVRQEDRRADRRQA